MEIKNKYVLEVVTNAEEEYFIRMLDADTKKKLINEINKHYNELDNDMKRIADNIKVALNYISEEDYKQFIYPLVCEKNDEE